MISFLKSLFGSEANAQEDVTVKNKDRNFDILKYDGVKALKMGKTGYAIRCFNEALALNEEFETMNYLASAYIQQNETELAASTYTRLTELEPEHIDTRLNRANLYFACKQAEETIADCQYILTVDTAEYRAYVLMARAKQTMKNHDEAIADLTQAISIKNDLMDAYLLRAISKLELQQYDEALADVNLAISLSPEEENAFLLRAKVYEAMKQTDAAIEDYSEVIALNPFNEQAYLKMGALLIAGHKLDEAIRHFDEAIEFKPDFAKAYAERGRAKELKGDNEAALEDTKQAATLSSEECEEDCQPVNFNDMYKNRPL